MIFGIIWTIVVIVLVLSAFNICKENERFVIFRLGRKIRVVAPGLIIVIPFIDKVARIRIGDTAEVLTSDKIILKGIEFPSTSGEQLNSGTVVRIVGFVGNGDNNVARVAI